MGLLIRFFPKGGGKAGCIQRFVREEIGHIDDLSADDEGVGLAATAVEQGKAFRFGKYEVIEVFFFHKYGNRCGLSGFCHAKFGLGHDFCAHSARTQKQRKK